MTRRKRNQRSPKAKRRRLQKNQRVEANPAAIRNLDV